MKNYVKILISFLAIMMIATSCKKDDNEEPTPEPPVEEKEFTTVSFAATVNLTPMQGSVEGVTFKTAFAAGDVIEITNPDVLYEPLTFALDEFAGKTAATFTIEAKVKKDAELTSGSTKLSAALKNGEKYNNGKPFVDVKQLTSLAEGIDQYSYWACPEFTFDSNNNTITLAQSTVFVVFNTSSVKLSLTYGNAFDNEYISGKTYYAVTSGATATIAALNFEQLLGENGKSFYNITYSAPDKCISALFSIGENKAIYFSNGNLQYRPMDGTWRLAPQQYHKCLEDGLDVGEDYADWQGEDKWTDIFWWGTWVEGSCPNRISDNIFVDYDLSFDANGELEGTCAFGAEWTVLSLNEWIYLLQTRPNADQKNGGAVVDDITGWVLLPDDWSTPDGISPFVAKYDAKYVKDIPNNYTKEQWAKMESAGAVFLPMTGYNMSTKILGSITNYQTRTNGMSNGEEINFSCLDDEATCGGIGMLNCMGAPIRLIQVHSDNTKVKVE